MMLMTVVRVPEAARQLGVSTREVLVLLDRGALPRGRDERGRLVVPVDALERFRSSL